MLTFLKPTFYQLNNPKWLEKNKNLRIQLKLVGISETKKPSHYFQYLKKLSERGFFL